MQTCKKVLIGVFIVLNLILGLRGLWREDRNFFTMHPFSDPIVTCAITAFDTVTPIPLPTATYRRLPSPIVTNRTYLEVIPLYERGLTESLRQSYPEAHVRIRCVPLFSNRP